jgi:hypothetical protein
MTMAATMTTADFTTISERQILQPSDAKGVRIGKVVRLRHEATGSLYDVRHWYDYSAAECPVHHIDHVRAADA